jgi:fructokinase
MSVLTCFGELLIDMLPNGNGGFDPIAGGAPANVAVGFKKLGGESRFVGGLSDDEFGKQLRKTLADYQVDTQHLLDVPGHATALALVQLDAQGERKFSFYRDNTADLCFPLSAVKAIEWPINGIFHLCSNTLTTDYSAYVTLAMLSAAKHHQQLISFDINLRLNLWHDVSLLPDRVEQLFQYCDILKFSKEELDYLAAASNQTPSSYIARLFSSFSLRVVIVSNGGEAVELYHCGHRSVLAVPNVEVVDTTGAGDSLVSGLLYDLAVCAKNLNQPIEGFIDKKVHVLDALNFAIRCGAFTCQSKGACPAMPTLSNLE